MNNTTTANSRKTRQAEQVIIAYFCDAIHMSGQEKESFSYSGSDLKEIIELAKADVADNCGIIDDPRYICLEVLIDYGDFSLRFVPDSDEYFSGKLTVRLGDTEESRHIDDFMAYSVESEIEMLRGTHEDLQPELIDCEEIPF